MTVAERVPNPDYDERVRSSFARQKPWRRSAPS